MYRGHFDRASKVMFIEAGGTETGNCDFFLLVPIQMRFVCTWSVLWVAVIQDESRK